MKNLGFLIITLILLESCNNPRYADLRNENIQLHEKIDSMTLLLDSSRVQLARERERMEIIQCNSQIRELQYISQQEAMKQNP